MSGFFLCFYVADISATCMIYFLNLDTDIASVLLTMSVAFYSVIFEKDILGDVD